MLTIFKIFLVKAVLNNKIMTGIGVHTKIAARQKNNRDIGFSLPAIIPTNTHHKATQKHSKEKIMFAVFFD